MKQRKGREEHPKRNRQYIALVLLLIVFLTVVLSGCLGSDKKDEQTEGGDFWEYIKISAEFGNMSLKAWEKALDFINENDFEKAQLFAQESKKFQEESYKYVLKAAETAETAEMKEIVACLAETSNFRLLYHEKTVEAINYWIEGEKEKASNAIKEGNDYGKKGANQALKCQEMKP